jgi:uncharacterized damage-inducible protein DinB
MNVKAFQHAFEYHFAENRNIWAYASQLSDEQFTQDTDYSHGSVRDQIVHLVSVDDAWFSGLRGFDIPEPLDVADFDDRDALRAHWDRVEEEMRVYLGSLQDETLFEKPFPEGEDENLIVWQVLFQVLNHGTDHRAQVLRMLNDLGVETTSQDYIFYAYENLAAG